MTPVRMKFLAILIVCGKYGRSRSHRAVEHIDVTPAAAVAESLSNDTHLSPLKTVFTSFNLACVPHISFKIGKCETDTECL